MLKITFIESVYNRIYGGRPSADFSILKADIEAYLPAVVNFAMTKGFYTQKNQEGNGDIPTSFYHTYTELPLLTDPKRNNRQYFLLPATLVSMPSNRGLRAVFDNCEKRYTPLNDNQLGNISYWTNIFKGQGFYNLDEKKVYVFNSSPLAETIRVTMIITAIELGDEDELSIPAGLEGEALEMCFEFVTGIKKMPVDRKNDARDLN